MSAIFELDSVATDAPTSPSADAKIQAVYNAALPNTFPVKFTGSLLDQLARGRALTDKQLACLDRLYIEATTACPMPTGAYVGAIGERMICRARVADVRRFDSLDERAPRYMVTYLTAAGDTLIHWTSRAPKVADVTSLYRLTVKDHKVFRGDKQTIVTRVVPESQGDLTL
jgi:hypothetical protein